MFWSMLSICAEYTAMRYAISCFFSEVTSAHGRTSAVFACRGLSEVRYRPSTIRKDCPFGVPISYGKDKLRTMALKLKGYNTRNPEDTEAFKKRFEKLGNYPLLNQSPRNLKYYQYH